MRIDSTYLSRDKRECPELAGEKNSPEPAWDKSRSERNVVVEIERQLRSGVSVKVLHDELNQVGFVVLPKGVGQAAEQLEQGERRLWWQIWR
jgi:hypothetical protein